MDFSFNYNPFVFFAGLILILISIFFTISKKTLKFILILRLLIFSLLLIILLKPTINIVKKEYIPAKVFYIIDVSIYMRSEFSENLKISKLEYIKKYLREKKVPKENIYFAADKIYKYEDFEKIPPDNFYTDFSNSVKNCESYSCNYDKLIYFTDGYTNLEHLENMDIVFVGEENKVIKKFIYNLKHPDMVFLHIPFNIYFDLSFLKSGKIELFEDSKKIFSKSYKMTDYNLTPLKDFITLNPSTIGKKDYKICATEGNEKQCIDFSINILRDKLRVLYLCGIPNHHYYFLREYLKSNPNIDLVSFVILREINDSLSVRDEDFSLIPFPREEIFFKDIFHFDILILEDFNFQEMGINSFYFDNIAKFVENGGSLLVIGGDIISDSIKKLNSESLKKILPSYPFSWFSQKIENFYFSPHPVSAALNYYIPTLTGIFSLAALADGAKNVVSFEYNGKRYPFISEKEYGKGRIVMINSSTLWQWKLKAFNFKDNYYFNNFYKNIFSWLDFTLNMNRVSYSFSRGDKFYINAYVLDENYKPVLKDDIKISGYISQKNFKFPLVFRYVSPGLYRAYYPPLGKGKYNFKAISYLPDGKKEEYVSDFFIENDNFLKAGYSKEKFDELSKNSKVYLLNDFDISKISSLKKEVKKIVRKIYLLDNAYFLSLLLFIILLELVYRRLNGEI